MKQIFFALLIGSSLNAGFALADVQNTLVAETETNVLSVQPHDRILGSADAPVIIYEYSSLSCPHCASFHNDILPSLKEKYIDTGKVALVARNFPTNAPALSGSLLTMCVDKEKYYPFLKVLFRMQNKWAFSLDHKDDLKKIANVGGVSNDEFDACMANEDLEKQVLTIRRAAEENLDIQATPTFFVNGEIIQGAGTVEGFAEVIDKQLAKIK